MHHNVMSTVPMLDNYIFFINIQHSYYNYLVLTVLDRYKGAYYKISPLHGICQHS